MPTIDDRALALIDAFLVALRDEAAAARSQRGESVTPLSDGRLVDRTPQEATYSFLLDHPVAIMDDAPVEMEVYGVRYPGKVVSSTSEELIVALETTDTLPPLIPHAGLIAKVDFLPRRLIERLTLLRSGDEPADLTLALRVFDPSPTVPTQHSSPEATVSSARRGLNDAQIAALETAQRSPVCFVWGPPGTGKTSTLARIAEAFCRQGKRVLVTAHANVAVDEAAHDIVRLFGDDPLYRDSQILRLGHHRQEALSAYDHLLFSRYTETLMRRLGSDRAAIAQQQRLALERARIVCATLTHVFFSPLVPQTPFDVCLVDETSMAPLPALFWALTRCRAHAVLIGDFLQLPPVAIAQSASARRWLGRNIYQYVGITTPDRARRDPRVVLLDRQYRMHPEIARLPNHLFYGHLLRTDATPIATTHTPLLLVDTAGSSPWCIRLPHGSRVNLHSASVAVHMAMSLPDPHEVAIITPYAAQARLIGALLRDRGHARTVRVATVHRFQGGEVPVLIFDSVEAPPERPAPMVNDLRDPSARLLLNVALTRAQRSLVVIAHQTHLRASLPRHAALVRLLDLMAGRATVVDSGAVLPPGDAREQFAADLLGASSEILAVLPAGLDWPPLVAALAQAEERGLRLTRVGHHSGDEQTAALRIGRPLVVIDRSVIWDGVPEPFAPPGQTSRRLVSCRAAAAIVYALLPPRERTAGPVPLAPAVVIPTRDPCPVCGALLDAVSTDGRIRLICHRSPECPYTRTLRQRDRIPTDIRCRACGHPTILIPWKGRAFLGCSMFPRCRHRSSIGWRRATA